MPMLLYTAMLSYSIFCAIAVDSIRVEQDCVFRTLSAILCLGNVEFKDEADEFGMENAVVSESYLVARVAELLGALCFLAYYCYNHYLSYTRDPSCFLAGVDRVALEQSLVTKYFSMEHTSSSKKRHSNIRSPRTAADAAYSRDAMAKSIYQVIGFPRCNVIP